MLPGGRRILGGVRRPVVLDERRLAVPERTFVQGRMQVAGIVGPIWMMGWMFTVGFCHLGFVRGLFALVIWPYYLGGQLG